MLLEGHSGMLSMLSINCNCAVVIVVVGIPSVLLRHHIIFISNVRMVVSPSVASWLK